MNHPPDPSRAAPANLRRAAAVPARAAQHRRGYLAQTMRAIAVAHACIPPMLVAWLIATRGVDVPFGDSWAASVELAARASGGELRFRDILEPYGPHPYVPTQIVTVAFARWGDWNQQRELWISPLLALLILATARATAQRLRPDLAPWLLVVFSWLVFAPRQVRNWLWSFQNAWFFGALFVVATIAILATRRTSWRALAGAATMAGLASLSILPGVLAWPVGALVLLIRREHPRAQLGAWVAAAATLAFPFWIHYHPPRTAPVTGLLDLLYYTAALLGNPFVVGTGAEAPLAAAIGASGLALFLLGIHCLLRSPQHPSPRQWLAAWIGWGTYSILGAAMAAVGRAAQMEVRPHQPLLSRYVTTAMPFWIALVAISAAVVADALATPDRARSTRAAVAGIFAAAVLLPLFVRSNAAALDYANWTEELRRDCVALVAAGGPADCLAHASWKSAQTAAAIPALRDRRLSLFRGVEPLPSPQDVVLSGDASIWSYRPPLRPLATRWQVRGRVPLEHRPASPIPIGTHPTLRVRVAISPLVAYEDRGPRMTVELEGPRGQAWTWAPTVVADGRPHTYVTQLPRRRLGVAIVAIRVLPLQRGTPFGDSSFELYEVRFLAAPAAPSP